MKLESVTESDRPDIIESEPIEENNQLQIQPHNRIV